MKILYGVQGTGNGHISRARAMASHFQATDIDVTWLFSGRPSDAFFDMGIFGDYLYRAGLTFHSDNGRVSYPKTVLKNNVPRFVKDVFTLDTRGYDLVITDFEPVSAWAARRCGSKVIGIGHQYAFGHSIPRAGGNIIATNVMKYFAPAHIPLGLHWHHFGNPILPPIIDTGLAAQRQQRHDGNDKGKKIVVYLPFENQQWVEDMLAPINEHRFVIYSPELEDRDLTQERSHIALRKTSLKGFKHDLTCADGVICNSGFELISECLSLGLPVLTQPQRGQMEQQSNAAALSALSLAYTVKQADSDSVRRWLATLKPRQPLVYPDVAQRLVQWLANGQQETPQQLSEQLWSQEAFAQEGLAQEGATQKGSVQKEAAQAGATNNWRPDHAAS